MRCALLEACGLQIAKVPLRVRCDVAAFLLALFTCPTVVVIRIEHLLPPKGWLQALSALVNQLVPAGLLVD